jgi:hypothetical protein
MENKIYVSECPGLAKIGVKGLYGTIGKTCGTMSYDPVTKQETYRCMRCHTSFVTPDPMQTTSEVCPNCHMTQNKNSVS